jgi:hypothetical protein
LRFSTGSEQDPQNPHTFQVTYHFNKVDKRLKDLGVVIRQPPTQMGPATVAVFDDMCGNLIQIAQKS